MSVRVGVCVSVLSRSVFNLFYYILFFNRIKSYVPNYDQIAYSVNYKRSMKQANKQRNCHKMKKQIKFQYK